MPLTQDELDVIANPALSRIAAGEVTLANQGTIQGIAANVHYAQTRKSLLRSFIWPFAVKSAPLSMVYVLTLDSVPLDGVDESPFEAGDTITGSISGTTATILSATSGTVYEIIDASGDFEDDEEITNGTATCDCGTGYPTVEAKEPSHKWTYEFALPSDGLRLVNIYQDDGSDLADARWEIQGKKLLTHYEEVNAEYIQNITDPTKYDELFIELFILKLAMKMINSVAGTSAEKFKAELREEIRIAEYRARVVAEQENNTTGRTDWILARYGVYGY